MTSYTPPAYSDDAFHCPHCQTYAHQVWGVAAYQPPYTDPTLLYDGAEIAVCQRCEDFTLWVDKRLVFPDFSGAEPPNPDMPEDVKKDYEEAAGIVNKSPRGAAALLRLGIQKLCKELGEKGKDINTDIGALVQKGLPSQVQKALDTVRVLGNEAVHPGELDLRDDVETATVMFRCVNIIVERMITEPKKIDALYQSLPVPKLAGIAQRDNTGAS